MFVVTALFEIKPGHAEAFRAGVLRNAAASLRDEPGCRRFDVCFSEDGSGCFLYELYDDRAAFDQHMRTGHFAEFDRAAGGMISGKRLETYLLIDNADAPAPSEVTR